MSQLNTCQKLGLSCDHQGFVTRDFAVVVVVFVWLHTVSRTPVRCVSVTR